MRLTIFLVVYLVLASFQTYCQPPAHYNSFLEGSRQLIFVKTANANAITGTMFLYERRNNLKSWKLIDSFSVTVGRTGLAWDEFTKIPHATNLTYKREGDGKSPAGIFRLGTVFSYHQVDKLKMPFQQVDTSDICVDDMNSVYYNRPTDADTVAYKDWNSFEYMHRKDNLYEYGIWVLYNNEFTPGKGSCIFLHIWENATAPTSGCTAMSKENILKLIHWLDEKKQPLLLQVTGN